MTGRPFVAARPPTSLRLAGSALAIRLPGLAAGIGDRDVGEALEELRGRDQRRAIKASEALAQLTGLELEALAAFACAFDADSPAKRSWRGRFLAACAALAKVDGSQLAATVMLARQRRDTLESLSGEPGRKRPISPFTAEPSEGGGA